MTLGQILAHHGLNGWLKVRSFTEPRDQLGQYPSINVGERREVGFEVRDNGKGLLLRLENVTDRETAQALLGEELWIDRSALPNLAPDEYYWCDLEGCRVENQQGEGFGTVVRVMATGAHDVLVVRDEKETLIPFVQGHYVMEVDLAARRIVVDWQKDYD